MYNKKALSKATAELDKAKAPKKPKDIITDPMGQWQYPGQVTRIPSDNITMKGVGYPVVGIANTGQRQIMLPGADYTFPGADYVDEHPQMKKGGSKKKTKSMSGTNRLLEVNELFKNYKNRRFDPKTKHFQEGGAKTLATNKSKDGTITNKVRGDGKTFLQVKTKDGKYYEKEIPTVTKAKGFEAVVSKSIGNPMDRAYDYVEKLRSNGEDPQDNLRHATAGRYTAEGLLKNAREGSIPFPDAVNKATSWLSANALGVGHELTTIFQDERPWGTKLREAAEDIYNNGVGVNQGLSDKSSKAKTQNLKNRSLNYELPDGYGEEHPYHNKWVDPYSKKQDGGDVETDLTQDEIDQYVKGGFIVEDISVPELNQAQSGGESKVILSKEHTDKKGNKTIVVTKDDGTKYTKVISKDGKVYNNTQAGLSPEMRTYAKKKAEWEDRSSGAAQPVDEFWTLPIGMTSAGVKGTVGLAKGLGSLASNAGKSSLVQATKAGTKALFNTAPSWAPGMTLGNAIGAGFAGSALTDIATGKVADPWKKANKSGKGSDYVDAINENLFTALDAIPLYGVIGKGARQLSKYGKVETPSGFKNRVFDSNLQLGSFKGTGHISEKGYNYRTLGDNEIEAIKKSKGVFPKTGKAKGGNENVKYWTKGNEKNWYAENPDQQVIRVNQNKFKDDKVVHAKDVEIYNHQTGKFESLNKIKRTPKKLIPSVQASSAEVTNSFIPNTLIHHPDNAHILQKTPVKDFGIKLNIKNRPDKSKHGFDVSDDEIKQVINQNLEYINHPEYIKRRQATTGESVEKIKKEIKDYTENLKHAKFDFDKVALKNAYGAHQRGTKILGKRLKSPKITVNSSDKAIKTKYDFLHVLDHEVKHALSPVSKNAFKAYPKYKNYPHVDLVKDGENSVYHSKDYEQQVRFLRMRDHLHNKFGISKHKELSPEEWDVFKKEWNGWLKEEHTGLGNKRVPRGLKDIRGMMELKHPDVSSEQLRKIINKSWALAPIGIAGAAVNYMPAPKKSKQMQEGGMVTQLTPKEIQKYINQGYIVEEH